MAVIHISKEEAARDLYALIEKVSLGVEVVIEGRDAPVAVLRSPGSNPPHRTISEAIRLSEERGGGVTLDDAFGDDMEEIMRSNRLPRSDPWESS